MRVPVAVCALCLEVGLTADDFIEFGQNLSKSVTD
jgi:hypothetical protein